MTRSHDMGGRFGDGPIPIKLKDGKFIDDEPVFEFNWHARALAITLASASVGKWSIDKGRFFENVYHRLTTIDLVIMKNGFLL